MFTEMLEFGLQKGKHQPITANLGIERLEERIALSALSSTDPLKVLALSSAPGTFVLPVTRNEANYRGFNFVYTNDQGVKKFHAGVDYYCSDLKAMAVAKGTVYSVYRWGEGKEHGLGNTVILEHTLANNTKIYTLYGHLASIDASISVGKVVLQGQILGKIGQTGAANNIDHLHFEIKSKGTLGNPVSFGNVAAGTHYGYVPISAGKVTAISAKDYGYFNPAVSITTSTLPNWSVGKLGYSQQLSASGGNGSLTWRASPYSLPTGLNLWSNGLLSGTPTQAGTYTFTITATDTIGITTSKSYTVAINPAVSICTSTLPSWTVSKSNYRHSFNATGGTGTLSWKVTSGGLPTGLTLSSNGLLSGTPTAARTFTFTITATDTLGAASSKTYAVVINPAVSISTSFLPNWTAGKSGYRQTFSAIGGTGPLAWKITAGNLPTGLTLSSSGVLSGTPTVAKTFTFTITATDSVGAIYSKSFSMIINR